MAIEPVTREERFLAAAGGQSVTPPTPITRKEQLLQGIIDAVKSGGASPDAIKEAVNDYLDENPVKPGATTEQAAQIERNKTDIADLQTEVDELKESGGNGSGQNVTYAGLPDKPKINGVELSGNKTAAEFGIEGATDEQVQEAVQGYLDEHPVPADEWPLLVPTLNGIHPINTITNERSVRTKSVQLNAQGTKAHNLAMVRLGGNHVFATWAEYTSLDNANGGGQCFQRWAVIKIVSNEAKGNFTSTGATFALEVISSGTLYEGASVAAGAISDASDACIFRLGDTRIAVMSKVTISGKNTPYSCTAVMDFDSGYAATITYHEPTINGGAWDMRTINDKYPQWVQFNSEPVLVGAKWYIAMVVSGLGVQVMSTADGIDFAPAFFVPCPHAYIEAALAMTNHTRFFLAIRSHYNDGDLYLVAGQVADGGAVTINGQRRIQGVGSSRPHIVKTSTQGAGGTVSDMPFFVVCTDANRRNGHIYRVRTYNRWGSGPIISADEVCAWGKYTTYPVHVDLNNVGNISNVMGERRQLMGATDMVSNTVSVFPVSCVTDVNATAWRDGADWATMV